MANLTINEFPTASSLTGEELVLIWKNGTTQNVDASLIAGLAPPAPPAPLRSVTSNYQIVAADNGTQFDNYGATGAVTLTLPQTWAAGLFFSFVVVVGQTVTIVPFSGSLEFAPDGEANSIFSAALYSVIQIGTSNQPGVWFVKSVVGPWDTD